MSSNAVYDHNDDDDEDNNDGSSNEQLFFTAKVFRGRSSYNVIIPRPLATKMHLDKPNCNVIMYEKDDTLVMKRLRLDRDLNLV